jgi:hypothetical protein
MDGLALTYDSEEPAPDILVLPSRYKQFCKVGLLYASLLLWFRLLNKRRRWTARLL